MNTNTLLNIYQSYTLTKVSELNKQSLVALYAQNEQLNKLNQELGRANRTTELILRNQIKEIERQERCRYFKTLSFNLSQAMTLLENEENVNFRIFASNLFLAPIRDMAQNAIQELDEIADKEYAQNIVDRSNVLSNKDKINIELYNSSSWASLLLTRSKIEEAVTRDIEGKKKEIKTLSAKKNEMLNGVAKKTKNEKDAEGCMKGCVITPVILLAIVLIGTIVSHEYEATQGALYLFVPALLVLILYYVGKNKKGSNMTEKNQEDIDVLDNEIQSLSDELTNLQQEKTRLTTQYNELLQDVTADCPRWEDKLKEIATLLPHEEKVVHRDPLLLEAAKYMVKEKFASCSVLQRKFEIGYNRAGKIMNQLEELGIVGPDTGSRGRELYCKSEDELLEILNK